MDILIEQGKKEEKLNYSELYHKVDDNLRGKKAKEYQRGILISRDVNAISKRKRLQRTEDKDLMLNITRLFFVKH